MTQDITRHLATQLAEELQHSPAVALLGPRQVGKTTLALAVSKGIPSIYLDLESERDRAKLEQAELYLTSWSFWTKFTVRLACFGYFVG
jgi:uncharacterized protein